MVPTRDEVGEIEAGPLASSAAARLPHRPLRMVWEELFPTAASNWSAVAMTTSGDERGGTSLVDRAARTTVGHAKSSLAVASKSGAKAVRNATTAMWAAAMGEAAAEGGRE